MLRAQTGCVQHGLAGQNGGLVPHECSPSGQGSCRQAALSLSWLEAEVLKAS